MPATLTLSDEQQVAVEAGYRFLCDSMIRRRELAPEQLLFRIGGYAGTGKTTILRELLERAGNKGAVVAYTGKAASVLRRKGVSGATTIHARIYRPETASGKLTFRLRTEDEMREAGIAFFVIDESSMVGRDLFRDLQSFKLPILAVGDPGQLEPVGSSDMNLMDRCDVTLEQIHRQSDGSPVIELARRIRLGEQWADMQVPGAIVTRGQHRPIDWNSFDAMLCGTNRTRHRMNGMARKHFKRVGLVTDGERIICLRNDSQLGVFNGLGGVVHSIAELGSLPNVATCQVLWDGADAPREQSLVFDQGEDSWKGGRGQSALVDYAYCITTHKAQGSEWDRVVVMDEQCQYWDAKRWRYTAVTRAAKSVVLVLP
jgi:exodeoxyribonuclease-5